MIRNFIKDCILFQSKDIINIVLGIIVWTSILKNICSIIYRLYFN